MKNQYLFEIAFIRLTLKTPTSQSLRLSLVSDIGCHKAIIKVVCSHQLLFRKLQRKLDLSSTEPFKFTVDPEQKGQAHYGMQLSDEEVNGKVIEQLLLPTAAYIQEFEKSSRSVSEQTFEGGSIDLQFVVTVNRKDPSRIELNILNPKEETDIRQSSRSRRPPELMIKTKSMLRASASTKALEKEKDRPEAGNLFKGVDHSPVKKPISKASKANGIADGSPSKESDKRETLSAIPQNLSAWLKKKANRQDTMQSKQQQVKQLLQSHHPFLHEVPTTKLSLKLQIVIALLIMGVFFLIADVFKKTIIARIPQKEAVGGGKWKETTARKGEGRRRQRGERRREGKRGRAGGDGAG